MRNERLAWLVTLPIAIIGCESAHALANALVGPADGDTGRFFLGAAGPVDLLTLLASLAAV